MAQYDGSIRIGTGIDQKGFKAGSKELESEARRMAKTVSGSLGDSAKIALQKQTDSFVKLNQQYANQEQKIKDLGSKLHDMQRQKIETAEFKDLSKDLDKAKASLDRLYERRDSYVELGKKTPPKLELDISDAERKVKLLEADIKELIYTNKAYLPVDTSKIEQEIAAAEQKQMQMYTALQTAADSLTQKTSAEVAEEERLAAIRENAVVGNQHIVEVVERRKQLLQEIKDLESAGITEGYVDYDRRIEELEKLDQEIRDYSNSTDKMKESYKGLSGLMKLTFSTMAKGFKDIPIAVVKSGVKGLISLFRGLGNVVMKTMVLPFKLFGTVSKKALSSIIPLLKRATSSMFGFGKSTKSSNNTLHSGLKNILKYGLGIRSMYALVNKLRTAIKEGFSNMANEVDGFKAKVDSLKASTLTLKNSFAAAFRPLVEAAIPYIQMVVDNMSRLLDTVGQFMAAIMGQKTYTKAIKQTTAAIEDENKAQNKQLSGLDKLNNLSSGSGAGDSDNGGIKMFEENVPVSNQFADIAQQFKNMWETADFSELGVILGIKLKTALENIPWDSIKQTVVNVGKSFATLINGLVEVPGLALDIGKTIGEVINTGISGINSFLDNTKWSEVGAFIGEGANSVVNTVDWQGIGHFFAAKFNAIFETIGEAARTFKWSNFGLELSNGFNTFISDFDWAKNGERLGVLVKGILDTIITFLENTNWQELGNKVADFIGSIDWTGIIKRLAEGIGAALGGLAALIWGLIEEAWNSVVGWWNEVAFEDGKFTFEGLLNGIVDAVKGIGTWIKEHIFQPFIEGFKKAFGIHSPSTVMEEMGNFLMEGLFNGISALVDNVISIFTTIKEKISEVWEKVKQVTSDIWEKIKQKISDIWNGIKSLVSNAVNNVKNTISNVWNTIKNTTRNVWNGIKGIFNGFMTFLTGVFTGKWEKAWDGIVKIFEGVKTSIKSVINGILGLVESLANGVINGINFVIGALNGLSFDVPKWVPLIGGETFGFNIPELEQISIPRLATGTVVPPNREFMAVLGDNKKEPEVVSPISTMKQAFKEAMSEMGGGFGNGKIELRVTANVEGRTLFEITQDYAMDYFNRTGRSPYPI